MRPATPQVPDPLYTITGIEQHVNRIVVTWGDSHRSTFHHVWLKHDAFFPTHRKAEAGDETCAWPALPEEAHPQSVTLNGSGDVEIVWDGDTTACQYDSTWLRDHCYSISERTRRRRQPVLWKGSLRRETAEVSYDDIVSDEHKLLHLFDVVFEYGFVIVTGVPREDAAIERVANIFGPLHDTPYGRLFDVRLDPTMNIGATGTKFLGPHVDFPYRHMTTGMLMLQCIEAHLGGGGQTLLVDGFAAAETIRQSSPELFRILSQVQIPYSASITNGDELRGMGRVFCLDIDGNVVGIRYNDRWLRALDLPEELIEPAYAGLRAFAQIVNDPESQLRTRLNPGDLLITDNHRVMHGRTYFDIKAGQRHLRSCEVDRDLFHNSYRKLGKRLGRKHWDEVLPWGVTA